MGCNGAVCGSGERSTQGWSPGRHGACPGCLVKLLPGLHISEFTSSCLRPCQGVNPPEDTDSPRPCSEPFPAVGGAVRGTPVWLQQGRCQC